MVSLGVFRFVLLVLHNIELPLPLVLYIFFSHYLIDRIVFATSEFLNPVISQHPKKCELNIIFDMLATLQTVLAIAANNTTWMCGFR